MSPGPVPIGPGIAGLLSLRVLACTQEDGDMFVRYFIEMGQPTDAVERALVDDPAGWIPTEASRAHERGARLLAEVGFGAAGRRVQREVLIELGTPMRFPSKTVVPMRWTPSGGEHLLPSLDADIEVAPLGPNRTHLSISARYQPPFGPIGRAADRALLHRVAEATIKDFLDRLAGRLGVLVRVARVLEGRSASMRR